MDSRLENKLDVIADNISDINGNVAIIQQDVKHNKDSLVEHMRRTALLESRIEEAEKPIQWVKMTAKIIAWTIPLISGILGSWLLFRK